MYYMVIKKKELFYLEVINDNTFVLIAKYGIYRSAQTIDFKRI